MKPCRGLIELLRALHESGFAGWKVVISGSSSIMGEGAAHSPRKPASLTTSRAILNCQASRRSGVRFKIFRESAASAPLRSYSKILRNLMVLDWVLRTNVVQSLSDDLVSGSAKPGSST